MDSQTVKFSIIIWSANPCTTSRCDPSKNPDINNKQPRKSKQGRLKLINISAIEKIIENGHTISKSFNNYLIS